ncbi:hypothetical protein DOY81_013220 [Sarcophaga bullata]|nr:hypothetical protein DOY81_013220 [Sarcophaga bullata]
MIDDDISLPADTLAYSNQFLAEKAQREQQELEKIEQKAGKEAEFEEDWVVKIFEFDKRFSAYGDDFVFYDFNEADNENYLQELWQQFDLIIADPPFLSEECITKVSKIIKNLLKPEAKIIFCSGEVVEPWLTANLNINKCNFRPEHERNLGNEFVSYANFNLDDFVKS